MSPTPTAICSISSLELPPVAEGQECIHAGVRPEIDISPSSSIATIRTTQRDKFLAPATYSAVAALTTDYVDNGLIYHWTKYNSNT